MVNKDNITQTNGTILIKGVVQDSDNDFFKYVNVEQSDVQNSNWVYPSNPSYTDDSNPPSKQSEKIYFQSVNIKRLHTLRLNQPLSIIVEFDMEHYLAKSIDFPIYAIGDDIDSAIYNIMIELEELYYELLGDDDFSDEWLRYKKLFKYIVAG